MEENILNGKIIAWVEDDYNIIYPLVRPLYLGGVTILSYLTRPEAWKARDRIRTCDLLLLDSIIPDLIISASNRFPGLSLLKDLRGDGLKLPVLLLTVGAQPTIREMEKKYGRDFIRSLDIARILFKPILPSELKQAVEEILS